MKDPTTFTIVERDQNGHYTRLALLYQDILKFAVFVKQGSFFKDRELARWLLYNNQHYFNQYKNLSNKKEKEAVKVNNILYDSVKDKLEDFVMMGLLVDDKAPASKSPHDVRVCGSTSDAELLTWLIESFDPNKREKAYDEAYSILQIKLNVRPQSSAEIFHSALYKKFKNQRLFGKFVIDPLRESLESNRRTRNIRQLRNASLVILPTNDPDNDMLHLSLWEETLSEMTPDVQDMLLYNMKLDIEHMMMYKCTYPKLYEEARYSYRSELKKVILEAYCADCKLTNCVYINTIEYLRRSNLLTNEPITHECPECKKDSLVATKL